MENNNLKEITNNQLVNILNPLINLKKDFTFLFNIDNIFSNEAGGKTRLNRDLFNSYHRKFGIYILDIKKNLNIIREFYFDEFKKILSNLNLLDNLNLESFFIDDKSLLDDLSIHLEKIGTSKDNISQNINSIKMIINLKNSLNSIEFFLNLFDTTSLNKHMDKYSSEELTNNSLIFDTINSYALLYEQVLRFDEELLNLIENNSKKSKKGFKSIEKLLELLHKRADLYYYLDNRYKISLDYDIKFESKNSFNIDISLLENLIFNLIEQSCLDTIKKDIKIGKTQKYISASFTIKKDSLEVKIFNNGFEVGNVDDLFALNSDNKLIIEAKNLLNIFNQELVINSIESEGMEYNFTLPLR